MVPCTPTFTTCQGGQVCGDQTDSCGESVAQGAATASHLGCGKAPALLQISRVAFSCQPSFNPLPGNLIVCGTCPAGSKCKPDGSGCETPVPQCVRRLACSAGVTCGTESDGCGGQVVCGVGDVGGRGLCPRSYICTAGKCVPGTPPCTPNLVAACAGKVCGTVSDGCGKTVNCGSCSAGATCSSDGSSCVRPQIACTPLIECTRQCGSEVRGLCEGPGGVGGGGGGRVRWVVGCEPVVPALAALEGFSRGSSVDR